MENDTSSTSFPVSRIWIFKPVIRLLIYFTFFVIFFVLLVSTLNVLDPAREGATSVQGLALIMSLIFFVVTIPFLGVVLLVQYLKLRNFKYEIGNDFLVFHQGIISKAQKNLPYAVIQNLIISQDIFDRLFKIKTLTIENASMGGGIGGHDDNYKSRLLVSIGFASNYAIIPGLVDNNAELLKEVLLKKIKTKSFADDRTGV